MSLVSTLGRIAVGVMVAKGVGKMMGGASGGASGGGLGGLLGGLLGGAKGGSSAGGGLGDLGSLLGGNSSANTDAAGGASGGLGGLLESIGGGAAESAAPSSGGFGDLLNSALQGNKNLPAPDASQEAQAELLIRAMISAAKCDGNVDQSEQQKIVSQLGDDVSEAERKFVIGEMQSPLNIEGLIDSVPRGAEQQVYMMSLMGIDLDSKAEAQYLDKLRKGMGLSEKIADALHQKLGVPTLYS